MTVTNERRRFLAAGILGPLSIVLSTFAALVGMLFGNGSDISLAIGVLGQPSMILG